MQLIQEYFVFVIVIGDILSRSHDQFWDAEPAPTHERSAGGYDPSDCFALGARVCTLRIASQQLLDPVTDMLIILPMIGFFDQRN
jgi:hypothetical protein